MRTYSTEAYTPSNAIYKSLGGVLLKSSAQSKFDAVISHSYGEPIRIDVHMITNGVVVDTETFFGFQYISQSGYYQRILEKHDKGKFEYTPIGGLDVPRLLFKYPEPFGGYPKILFVKDMTKGAKILTEHIDLLSKISFNRITGICAVYDNTAFGAMYIYENPFSVSNEVLENNSLTEPLVSTILIEDGTTEYGETGVKMDSINMELLCSKLPEYPKIMDRYSGRAPYVFEAMELSGQIDLRLKLLCSAIVAEIEE